MLKACSLNNLYLPNNKERTLNGRLLIPINNKGGFSFEKEYCLMGINIDGL